MTYFIIAAIILLVGISVSMYRIYFPAFTKKKAHTALVELLFPEGKEQQQNVMNVFHQLTSDRFTDDQIVDYFIKIKGLQTLDLNIKTNFWVKKYLLSPTEVKLNYFEQVKFYETFMNYPKSFDGVGKKKTNLQTADTVFTKENKSSFLKREYA
jgi:hypothetical protein